MAHIPYGYRFHNGKAVIADDEVEQLKSLYIYYISGLSLEEAGKRAGIDRCHASLSKMLTDTRYVNAVFYPPIINQPLFDKVQIERHRRAEILGRVRGQKDLVQEFPRLQFHISEITQVYDDPFRQAEYAYSQIQSEVITDDK